MSKMNPSTGKWERRPHGGHPEVSRNLTITQHNSFEFRLMLSPKDARHLEHMSEVLKITPLACIRMIFEDGITNFLIADSGDLCRDD